MSTYLLELGANVVITSRKLDVLQKTATEMESKTGGKVLAVACDVRYPEQVEDVLKATVHKADMLFQKPFNGVDLLEGVKKLTQERAF